MPADIAFPVGRGKLPRSLITFASSESGSRPTGRIFVCVCWSVRHAQKRYHMYIGGDKGARGEESEEQRNRKVERRGSKRREENTQKKGKIW
eukprot:4623680-Ditylum_brightwellii.AAC.1